MFEGVALWDEMNRRFSLSQFAMPRIWRMRLPSSHTDGQRPGVLVDVPKPNGLLYNFCSEMKCSVSAHARGVLCVCVSFECTVILNS